MRQQRKLLCWRQALLLLAQGLVQVQEPEQRVLVQPWALELVQAQQVQQVQEPRSRHRNQQLR